jgi:aldehyde dehydrogenase (NAD+)
MTTATASKPAASLSLQAILDAAMAGECLQFDNYIGGKWQQANNGQTFANTNPANPSDVIGYFPQSTQVEIDAAVSAGKEAYEKWRLMPAPRRGEIMYRAGNLLIEHKEALSRLMTREMGKVVAETRGDVQEAIDMVFYMAGEGRRLFGDTTPSELAGKFCMTVRDPLGVVGLITPWNFPMAIPSWKIAPALICGNAMVLKPASDTPLSSLLLVKVFEEAGLPKGVINVVFGPGSTCGEALMAHKGIKLISFTGSCDVGRRVNEACAPEFKHVSLEMGGKNCIIIMDDANLELAVDGAIWAAFGTSGQRCTAASRIIVHNNIHGKVRDMMLNRMKELKLGYGNDDSVVVGPVVNESAMNKILEYIAIGQNEDKADLLAGGQRAEDAGSGWFIQPTLFDNVKPGMRIAQEEIFGPVTALMPVADLKEAVEVANGIDFGLSTAIYTKNINQAMVYARDVQSGLAYINAPTIGAEVHLPFGGMKHTGNGHRDAGQACLETYSETKAIFIDYSDTLQRAQIDNE